MAYETVIYEPGPVARVILNRPEVQNAQSWTLLSEMEDAFEDAVADPECRIIVLSGEGESFSAGHDLDSPEQVAERKRRAGGRDPFTRSEIFTDVYIDSHLRWRDLPKPTVAMVHGKCALTLRTIKNSINHTLDQMGFTTSVRAIRPEFQNMIARLRPRRREGEPSEPERRPTGGLAVPQPGRAGALLPARGSR